MRLPGVGLMVVLRMTPKIRLSSLSCHMPSFFPRCAHDCCFGTAASTLRHTLENWCNLHRTEDIALSGYIGCFADPEIRVPGPAIRALPITLANDDPGMTVEKCRELAFANGLPYFGVQFGSSCFGGSDLQAAMKSNSDKCQMPCSGNRAQVCGGYWANSLYRTGVYVHVCGEILEKTHVLGTKQSIWLTKLFPRLPHAPCRNYHKRQQEQRNEELD
jgi:hypothetical protein